MKNKWEYTAFVGKHRLNNGVFSSVPNDDLKRLNEFGKEGWEVCNISAVEQINFNAVLTSIKLIQTVYILKRPLDDKTNN